jgi:hypothetical protein
MHNETDPLDARMMVTWKEGAATHSEDVEHDWKPEAGDKYWPGNTENSYSVVSSEFQLRDVEGTLVQDVWVTLKENKPSDQEWRCDSWL